MLWLSFAGWERNGAVWLPALAIFAFLSSEVRADAFLLRRFWGRFEYTHRYLQADRSQESLCSSTLEMSGS